MELISPRLIGLSTRPLESTFNQDTVEHETRAASLHRTRSPRDSDHLTYDRVFWGTVDRCSNRWARRVIRKDEQKGRQAFL